MLPVRERKAGAALGVMYAPSHAMRHVGWIKAGSNGERF